MRNTIKNTTLADRLLFISLVLTSVAGIFLSREALSRDLDVIIEVDGIPAYTFSLDDNRTIPVTGPFGVLLVEIKNKKVRAKQATCLNQICVKEGWIDHGTIICLPNRIIVTVGSNGKSRQKDIDAVTG